MREDLEQLRPADVRDTDARFRLDGEVALVTGGGNGMGRVVAFVFAAAGADVAIADRLTDNLERTAAEIRDAFDAEVAAVEADVSDPAAIERMVETTVSELGGLDVLANVAGVSTLTSTEEIDPKTWDLVQDVNLRGGFLAAKAARPHLAGGGRIVNISSIAGLYGATTMSHYAAAKAGVKAFTRSIAREWAADDVRANAVAPGPILTPGSADLFEELPTDAYDRTRVDRDVGSPAEIADALLFLASPASSYVSGQTIEISGPPPTQEDVSVTRDA